MLLGANVAADVPFTLEHFQAAFFPKIRNPNIAVSD